MQVSIYRCFLPDLTGFIDLHCIGPRSSGIQSNQIFLVWLLSREFSPAIADCRYRAPLAPRLARPNLTKHKTQNVRKSIAIYVLHFTFYVMNYNENREKSPVPFPVSYRSDLQRRRRIAR